MRHLKLINPENVSEQEASGYRTRTAARAIVFDSKGLVALLHATNNFYYKLPGGGLEDGEDHQIALKRECQEEIGCDIEVTGEVGSTLEYRKKFGLKQISYCYLAKLVGEKGNPALTESETKEGFQTVWLPLDQAILKVKESKPIVYEGIYMVPRDLVLLEVAKDLL